MPLYGLVALGHDFFVSGFVKKNINDLIFLKEVL